MVLPCTSELCNYISYQVEVVRAQSTDQFTGSITTVARHVGVSILRQLFVMWRPRDTISAQTMARHQSRV